MNNDNDIEEDVIKPTSPTGNQIFWNTALSLFAFGAGAFVCLGSVAFWIWIIVKIVS